ncbi:glycosyl-4,4'-diaponeurosporenoate acyltransferase [Priestia aryabhattai]|uniref:glycosyl-4,4'-diaponeurosporenoate acyltransferase CrtO family protein n=1 Tax=Bacillus sp. CBEL-1 TaxID=2502980 RepID=UPI000BA0138A|nr:glycosyl-4,4'-diaponeurosporenoate acyltransferase [Bacillus sp. CBEL-1]OZT14216.1 glycosyl-4,4'-diaponeurosporenoate acyltransferase [Priestia aryabhattai]TDB54971.1 glycosyl-4,4'-diaponeurosporenoate acyltransferase [Bacillus sp. CBEL-1]
MMNVSPVFITCINISAWLFFHMAASYVCGIIPITFFEKDYLIFKRMKWETDDKYKKVWIHKWKILLPDAGKVMKQGFYKKTWESRSAEYTVRFLMETKRAELTHWMSICPAFLFFLWNSPSVGWVMVCYACVVNIPFIIIQRYNRIRIARISQRLLTSE